MQGWRLFCGESADMLSRTYDPALFQLMADAEREERIQGLWDRACILCELGFKTESHRLRSEAYAVMAQRSPEQIQRFKFSGEQEAIDEAAFTEELQLAENKD